MEKDAGLEAKFTNKMYEEAGAKVVDSNQAFDSDIVLKVRAPELSEVRTHGGTRWHQRLLLCAEARGASNSKVKLILRDKKQQVPFGSEPYFRGVKNTLFIFSERFCF